MKVFEGHVVEELLFNAGYFETLNSLFWDRAHVGGGYRAAHKTLMMMILLLESKLVALSGFSSCSV